MARSEWSPGIAGGAAIVLIGLKLLGVGGYSWWVAVAPLLVIVGGYALLVLAAGMARR